MKNSEQKFVPDFIRKYRRKRAAKLLTAIMAVLLAAGATAEGEPQGAADSAQARNGAIMDMTIEELSNLTVNSPGRRSERLSTAATAIHVITQEDIRRSGATSIAEALRLSPGLEVARQDNRATNDRTT